MVRYSLGESAALAASLLLTKLQYPQARLIRRPAYVHRRHLLAGGRGLTTGHHCRFDLGDAPDVTGPTLAIGDDCQFGDNVHIVANERVSLGRNCLLASKVFVSDTSHGSVSGPNQEGPHVAPARRRLVTAPVKIGNNVWIGENVSVLAGVTIGDGSIIGANAVVLHDIEPGSVAAGVPAKVLRRWNSKTQNWERV